METSQNLPNLVQETFKAAQENEDLTFYATQVALVQCDGIPFQLRFSPSLANKPKPANNNTTPIDPFENPPAGLFITDLPSHNLVLNKFPVIPGHFILATKEFKQQTDLLEEDDLGAMFKCLSEYRKRGEELFGFFNSGEYSGASQPHRHIQFLPVESMRIGIEAGIHWTVLVDKLVGDSRPDLPFTYFSSALPEDPSPKQFHEIYNSLYELAVRATQRFTSKSGKAMTSTTRKEESQINYNLGVSDRVMVLCPRLSEGLKIKNGNGDNIGTVSLNGTMLGGTLLVRNEDEWKTLRNDESQIKNILHAVGIPPNVVESEERL